MKQLIFAGLLSLLFPKSVTAQTFQEVNYSPEKTQFALFAPNDAKRVTLRIYEEGQGGKAVKTVKMKRTADEQWTTTVRGDLMGKFYTFDVGLGECPGVFAKAVGVNGKRGAIISLPATDPEGWSSDTRPVTKSPADLVIYEMHHRDFSIARSDARYKGKFLALTEPWAISHLKELGVNAVHILPSYDYGSIDETRLSDNKYNWGYDPVNYNVPEGGYSTDPYRPDVRIREFKQMVKALHDAGIRVILDVVYNHTYDIEHSNFQRTYPDYFYRLTDQRQYSNGSGCGNETASDRPMMRKFMLESVKYWISEYHIDGFRFDLMGVHDIETMNQIRQMVDQIDPTIFIYDRRLQRRTARRPARPLLRRHDGRLARAPERDRIRQVRHRRSHRPPTSRHAESQLRQGALGTRTHADDLLCQLSRRHVSRRPSEGLHPWHHDRRAYPSRPARTDRCLHLPGRALHAQRRRAAARQERRPQLI